MGFRELQRRCMGFQRNIGGLSASQRGYRGSDKFQGISGEFKGMLEGFRWVSVTFQRVGGRFKGS